MAALFVIFLRFIIPISIFRWSFAGGVSAMLLDGADVILVDLFALILGEQGGFGTYYHALDKWLDIYYFGFEFLVSLKWTSRLARNASSMLFVWRVAGMVAFEITGIRKILFFAPNLFENFFLYYVAAMRFFPRLIPQTIPRLLFILFLLYIPKFGQEWVLHYKELQPWNWLKSIFFAG